MRKVFPLKKVAMACTRSLFIYGKGRMTAEDREDLIQDTLLYILEKGSEHFGDDEQIQGAAWNVTRFFCRNFWSRYARTKKYVSDLVVNPIHGYVPYGDETLDPDSNLGIYPEALKHCPEYVVSGIPMSHKEEICSYVLKLIPGLSLKQQQMFWFTFLGCTQREIIKLTGIAGVVSTVHTMRKNIIEQLPTSLVREELDARRGNEGRYKGPCRWKSYQRQFRQDENGKTYYLRNEEVKKEIDYRRRAKTGTISTPGYTHYNPVKGRRGKRIQALELCGWDDVDEGSRMPRF